MARLRALYGSSPLHALALLASFAIAGYAAVRLFDGSGKLNLVLWLVGAIVLHDFVLLPLYSALDRIAAGALRRGPLGPGTVNYLRVPALLCGLLLLVYFPSILALNEPTYRTLTTADAGVFVRRYLLICAVLFVASALLCALRLRRSGARAAEVGAVSAGPPP